MAGQISPITIQQTNLYDKKIQKIRLYDKKIQKKWIKFRATLPASNYQPCIPLCYRYNLTKIIYLKTCAPLHILESMMTCLIESLGSKAVKNHITIELSPYQ